MNLIIPFIAYAQPLLKRGSSMHHASLCAKVLCLCVAAKFLIINPSGIVDVVQTYRVPGLLYLNCRLIFFGWKR